MILPPRLAVYVSGHGLGHSARTLGVVNALPPSVGIVVSTGAPRWFWEGELTRPVEWRPRTLDVGALQLDTLRCDGPGTLAAFAEHSERADALIEEEKAFLLEMNAGVVLSDVGSIPLAAARALGIPAILLCNFTWADIYRPYIDAHPEGDAFEPAFAAMVARYRGASHVLKTPLAMAMPELEGIPTTALPLVCRRHRPVEAAFRRAFALAPDTDILLISQGQYGQDFDYGALGALPGVRAFSFNAPPEAEPHITRLSYPVWRSQDVTAFATAVVAKTGYGTLAECMSTGTPLIYPPREGFAEHGVLVEAIEAWGGGIGVSAADFGALNLGAAIAAVRKMAPLRPVPSGGAEIAGSFLLGMLGGGTEGMN